VDSEPRPADERRPATPVNALCCVCGNLRTVSSDYCHRYHDPDHAGSTRGKAEGWRKTQALKCNACGESTRHALLNPADAPYRDGDERQQLIALGDPDTSKYAWSDEHIARLRSEYRKLFPRNPFLRHRYWTTEAKAAWNDGSKKVTALCGEPITLESDPGRPSTKKEVPGKIVADQLGDTEYEDPETGLWWIDMACVDCCRVSNNNHRAYRRKRMTELLGRRYLRADLVADEHVEDLIAALGLGDAERFTNHLIGGPVRFRRTRRGLVPLTLCRTRSLPSRRRTGD